MGSMYRLLSHHKLSVSVQTISVSISKQTVQHTKDLNPHSTHIIIITNHTCTSNTPLVNYLSLNSVVRGEVLSHTGPAGEVELIGAVKLKVVESLTHSRYSVYSYIYNIALYTTRTYVQYGMEVGVGSLVRVSAVVNTRKKHNINDIVKVARPKMSHSVKLRSLP